LAYSSTVGVAPRDVKYVLSFFWAIAALSLATLIGASWWALPRHFRDTSETALARHLRDTCETPARHRRDTGPLARVAPAQDGGYVHDLHGAAVRSRLTFLVYLNDGFDGGCTTFFQPAAAPAGAQRELDRFEVTPLAGSALCFPQSATASLLHEGSPVTRGVKYVIRTDVLYRF